MARILKVTDSQPINVLHLRSRQLGTAFDGPNREMTQHPCGCLRRQHHTTRKILRALLTSPSRLHPNLSPHHCSRPVQRGPPLKMSSLSIFRMATRAVRPTGFFRAPQLTRSRMQSPVTLAAARASNFGTTSKLLSGHEDETYEEFSARYGPNRKPLT
jgi:hypothetical protein